MASPQLENGYTRIANELLYQILSRPFTGVQLRSILWIARRSYGWRSKTTPRCGIREMSREIRADHSSVLLALRVLQEAGIISIEDGRWSINKDHDQWGISGGRSHQGVVGAATKSGGRSHQGGGRSHQSSNARQRNNYKDTKEKEASDPSGVVSPQEQYVPKTPHQRVICAYKVAIGIPYDDRAWDKAQYGTWARAAAKLLAAFDGADKTAAEWLLEFGERMKKAGRDWNLATAAKHAWDGRGERMAQAAREAQHAGT